jgi:hypothetical protein
MMPALDKTGPDGQGCRHREGGHRHGHGEDGRCCDGRHYHEEGPLSREEEIAVLERQIADSEARLYELIPTGGNSDSSGILESGKV